MKNQKSKIKNQKLLKLKIFLPVLYFAMTGFSSFAQTDIGSLRLNARQGQGFIVMNQPKSTKYNCWHYVFSERTGNVSKTNPTGVIQLNDITVCGKDYFSLPNSYRYDRKRDIIMTVYGVTKTSEIKVLDGIRIGNYSGPAKVEPGQTTLFRCGAVCDGNFYLGQSYGFALNVYENANTLSPNGNGSAYLILEETVVEQFNGDIPLPGYGYYNVQQANAWAAARSSSSPSIELYRQAYDYPISPMLNTDDLSPGVVVRDPSGTPLLPGTNYYMIKKDLGVFNNDLWRLVPDYNLWGTYCNNGVSTLNAFMNAINTYYSQHPPTDGISYTPLLCYGDGYSYSDLSGETGGETGHDIGEIDFWEYINYVIDKENVKGISSHIISVELHSINNFSKTLWSSKTGLPILGEKLTVPAGLYFVDIAFSNGKFRRLFIDSKDTKTFTSQIKDLVDVKVFPVPIIGDKYTLDLQSTLATTFIYELWDGKGIKILTRNLEAINTGATSIQIPISSDIPIPSGNLIHKFIFTDGSIKTINTIK